MPVLFLGLGGYMESESLLEQLSTAVISSIPYVEVSSDSGETALKASYLDIAVSDSDTVDVVVRCQQGHDFVIVGPCCDDPLIKIASSVQEAVAVIESMLID